MARIVKTAEARRAEILDIAGRLFAERGFAATSVDAIVQATGVAKGTFYYHFRTKEDVLEALVDRTAERMEMRAREIASAQGLDPVTKLRRIFSVQRDVLADEGPIVDHLHLPENRELHIRSHIALVRRLGPVLAEVVEEGTGLGLFAVEDALSTVQFILAGAAFLFDDQAFAWTPEQELARLLAMVRLAERALGASPGAFQALLADAAEGV